MTVRKLRNMRKVSLVRVQNSERLRFNSSSGDSVSVSGGLYAFGNHLEIDCRQAGIRYGLILVGCLGRGIMLARNGNASDEQLQQVQHGEFGYLQILKGCFTGHRCLAMPFVGSVVIGSIAPIRLALRLLRAENTIRLSRQAVRGLGSPS
jgi:hypothetical protein